MEYLWRSYGVPMEQHAPNKPARRQQHAYITPSPRLPQALTGVARMRSAPEAQIPVAKPSASRYKLFKFARRT